MFSGIFAFLLNVLMVLLFAILGFFGISLGSSVSEGFSDTPAMSTEAVATPVVQADSDVVDVDWLASQIGSPGLVIVALTPANEFAGAHIPGAVQIDWPAFSITDTSDASVQEWASSVSTTLGVLGISQDSRVVVYDDGTHYAPRLWWILKALGHQDAYLLDGGLSAWQSSGQAVDSGAAVLPPAPATFQAYIDPTILATKTDVEAALDQPGTVLVDARTPEEYAAGHIPGAVNIPFTENYANDGTLLDFGQLIALYASQGITSDTSVIVYCSTGVRAASDYLALSTLMYPDVRLYLGSYDEWGADPSLPVEK